MTARPNINLAEVIASGGQVIFQDADWEGYERFRDFFAQEGYGRVSYCDGILEIIGNESFSHEVGSRILEHLIVIYAILIDRKLYSGGSTLLGSKEKDAGKNPDECFWFDSEPAVDDSPDLVVEVVITTEAISKQSFYAKFEVPELWIWEENEISVYLLKVDRKGYKKSKVSRIFPDLDMKLVERCCALSSISEADELFRKESE